jgi:hypothetical protein
MNEFNPKYATDFLLRGDPPRRTKSATSLLFPYHHSGAMTQSPNSLIFLCFHHSPRKTGQALPLTNFRAGKAYCIIWV